MESMLAECHPDVPPEAYKTKKQALDLWKKTSKGIWADKAAQLVEIHGLDVAHVIKLDKQGGGETRRASSNVRMQPAVRYCIS